MIYVKTGLLIPKKRRLGFHDSKNDGYINCMQQCIVCQNHVTECYRSSKEKLCSNVCKRGKKP